MTVTTDHPAAAAYKRARRHRRGDALVRLVVYTVQALLAGWLLMLAVGIAHHEWIHALPTIGYSTAIWLAVLIRIVFTDFAGKVGDA